MLYLFLGFTFDSTKKELYYQSKKVELTKQNYQLLYFFLENPRTIVDKDKLIKEVWMGRIVADNTIDQSIYKLKKILTSINNEKYFETIYGLGIKFLPKTTVLLDTHSNVKSVAKSFLTKKILLHTLILIFISIVFRLYYPIKSTNIEDAKPIFIVLPNEGALNVNDWLQKSPSLYIEKILSHSSNITLKHYQDKPNNLDQQQYLKTQWKLSPNLNVVTSNVSINEDLFSVTLSLLNKQGKILEQTFQHKKLTNAFSLSMHWLTKQTETHKLMVSSNTFIPKDPYLLELYMRGLLAEDQQKIDEAINYFELCRNENPDFHLATIELAKLMDRKGEQDKALVLLDTIRVLNTNAAIEIESDTIRGGILLRQGKPEETEKIYTSLLNKYTNNKYQNLLSLRYKLSLLYSASSKYQKALSELKALEPLLTESQNHEYLAENYQAQGSIYLTIGQIGTAKIYVNKAMEIFVRTNDLIGQAKAHSVTARISVQQANYVNAISHLKQSLNITRSLDYKFGVGATLNEIISVLILQGKTNEAWKLNQELEEIALDIDFTAMLLASKIHTIEISKLQNQWKKANIYLKEHQELAQASNYVRGLKQNTLLAISVKLDQKITKNIPELLKSLEFYIEDTGENLLRLQVNILRSQYYFLVHEQNKAETLLLLSKTLAIKEKDTSSIIKINNLLAEYYLKIQDANKALALLIESEKYNPTARPYLMLKSKAYLELAQLTKSLETVSMCKRQSNDLWTIDDESYLTKLIELKTLKLN